MSEQVTDLENWKKLLTKLEAANGKLGAENLEELESLFRHLATQVSVRLQREYEACTLKSDQLFGELFDRIDLSNKPLLCTFLRMLRSFAYFRIAQISYHIDSPPRDGMLNLQDVDSFYQPAINKSKWYDLSPVLPQAGTIGWKMLMNHGIVKEERELLQVCLQLLAQKLHFLVIILNMNQYQSSASVIRKNGKKVAEKLFELIVDVGYDDETMIGLDVSLFNLLMPFTNADQHAAIIEAVVQDLFKPFTTQRDSPEHIETVYVMIDQCLMNKLHLQDTLFVKLLEHLKCNAISRKRRHSVEASAENSSLSFEYVIGSLLESKIQTLSPTLEQASQLELSSKGIQSAYLKYWTQAVERMITDKTLSAQSSLRLLITGVVVLISASKYLSSDLILNISSMLSRTIEATGINRLEHLFNVFNLEFMMELAKTLATKGELLSSFDSPVQQFYEAYLNRFLKYCLIKGSKGEAAKFTEFVNFLCDKSIGSDAARLLQFTCLTQLEECLRSYKNRQKNAIVETFMECARTCSRNLYKFIKRANFLKLEETDLNEADESFSTDTSSKQEVRAYALVSIISIAVEHKDQETLDQYSELSLKLLKNIQSRVESLIEVVQTGRPKVGSCLDAHLIKMLYIYHQHRDLFDPLLNQDLIESVVSCLYNDCPVDDGEALQQNGTSNMKKSKKKKLYLQIKNKLADIEQRAAKSADVYPTIINKQYTSVAGSQSLSTVDVKQDETTCYRHYWTQINSLSHLLEFCLNHCKIKSYKTTLEKLMKKLESCDALNHTDTLYNLLVFECLILRKENENILNELFKELAPRISCAINRIVKSVELGPSIHAFSSAGSHKSNRAIQCCTYASCIKIYTLISAKFPKLSSSYLADAINIGVSSNLIQYAKHSSRLHFLFVHLAAAITNLVRTLSFGKKEYGTQMSSFLALLINLIRCVILASDKSKLPVENGHGEESSSDDGQAGEEQEKEAAATASSEHYYRKQLELLALEIGKILNNLSLLKIKMVDYAPYLISAYIKDIQKASCPDDIRLHLDEGMFRIFNLVDAHQKQRQIEIVEAGVQRKTMAGKAKGSLFEMIHARLDQASREIFKDMHDNYNRFHRYLAKC